MVVSPVIDGGDKLSRRGCQERVNHRVNSKKIYMSGRTELVQFWPPQVGVVEIQ